MKCQEREVPERTKEGTAKAFGEKISGIIQEIINDYESIVGLNTLISFHNCDYIRFRLGIENLPHFLGLQYFVDIPVLEANIPVERRFFYAI